MVRSGAFRREQKKHEVDRLVVDGAVVYGRVQSCEQPVDALQVRKPAMRNCHPLADAGRTQTLALDERLQYATFRKPRQHSRAPGKLLEELLLALDLQRGNNTIRREQICDVHGVP